MVWLYFSPTMYIAEKEFHIWPSVQILPVTVPANRVWEGGEVAVIHCNENPIYVFLFWELRGLSTNFHIHVSVSDLYMYIPRISPYVWLKIDRPIQKYIISHRYTSVGIEGQNIIILFWTYGGWTVSFLGINNWEPDINIRFSPAIHLKCIITINFIMFKKIYYRLLKKQCLSLQW